MYILLVFSPVTGEKNKSIYRGLRLPNALYQHSKLFHGQGENPPCEKGYRVVLGVNKYWGLSYKKGVHIKEGVIRIKEGNRDRGLKRYYIIC